MGKNRHRDRRAAGPINEIVSPNSVGKALNFLPSRKLVESAIHNLAHHRFIPHCAFPFHARKTWCLTRVRQDWLEYTLPLTFVNRGNKKHPFGHLVSKYLVGTGGCVAPPRPERLLTPIFCGSLESFLSQVIPELEHIRQIQVSLSIQLALVILELIRATARHEFMQGSLIIQVDDIVTKVVGNGAPRGQNHLLLVLDGQKIQQPIPLLLGKKLRVRGKRKELIHCEHSAITGLYCHSLENTYKIFSKLLQNIWWVREDVLHPPVPIVSSLSRDWPPALRSPKGRGHRQFRPPPASTA